MNYYDERYSAYFAAPDADYPLGSAVDSTSEDNLDGTPYLAAFFNDVIGSMQAVIFGVFGKDYKVSGSPDSCGKSDVWDAIQKFVNDGDKTVKDALDADIAALDAVVKAINAKIPSAASATNQLADKAWVNGLPQGAPLTASNPISNTNPPRLDAGKIQTHTVYSANGPATYGNLINIGGSGGGQLFLEWTGNQSSAGQSVAQGVWYRSMRDNQSGWTNWTQITLTSTQLDAVNSGATAAKINLIKTMGGASASANGSGGFVPEPKAGDQAKVLRGDGTWIDISGNIGLQAAFDAAHPVGSTYTQFPQQDPPETVFNKNGVKSTWSVLDYGGAFFRAQGGNAETFKSKSDVLVMQMSQNLKHEHEYVRPSEYENKISLANTRWVGRNFITAKTTEEGGDEARPVNYTIRIWKRYL